MRIIKAIKALIPAIWFSSGVLWCTAIHFPGHWVVAVLYFIIGFLFVVLAAI